MNPASERMLQHFSYDHLPVERWLISGPCYTMAVQMATELDSNDPTAGVEVTTGLRKLLEAKDCFVRAHVALSKLKES